MQRPIAITSGIAAGCIALAIALSPVFVSQRAVRVKPSEIQVDAGKRDQVPVSLPSGSNAQNEFLSEEIPVTARDLQDKEFMVAGRQSELEQAKGQEGGVPDEMIADIRTIRTQAPKTEMEAFRKIAIAPSSAVNLSNKMRIGGVQSRLSDPDMGRPVDQTYVGRDQFDTITTNPVKLASEAPVSTFSIDVDTASYAFVRRALNSGYLPQKNAVRVEEMINYFDYDYSLPDDRSVPFKPTVAVFPTPWNADTRLLHIGIKGYDIVPSEKPGTNLIFLVDVSGSMSSEDKLPLLKNSLRMLVNSLQSEDTVGIVVYAGAAGTVLEPTRVAEKGKILAALERLQAGGSTAGGEGIELAYSLAEAGMNPEGVNRVILATDGDFNVGIRDPEVLKDFVARKRKTGVYLSVLGFGQGNYNDALMQKLAQNGNGNAAYIDTLNEARKVLVDEATGTLFTIANDVKLQVEFNPAMVAEYRLIGYESRLLNREDFKNDAVDAGDIGSGHSVTAIYEITPTAGESRLIDPLRYQSDEKETVGGREKTEYAFLKIRYKLPGESSSQEISKAIDRRDEFQTILKTPENSRFAAAVAAFSQILRGDADVGDFGCPDVLSLAQGARGDDPYGYRAEFLNLVRLAETAEAMGER